MRSRYEFAFVTIASGDPGAVDPALALMGSQGWKMRGLAAMQNGELAVGLQRPLDEEIPLPDGMTLAATLDEPLSTAGLEADPA
ncbi:MAG: hypothetical protein IAI48_12635 [Candidatus Eremiobacteraeota bacterium]|nr:hypothetical protein [Candidatus Eremiobacteraeota bacterium]